jgi:hypothetical protein
VRAECSDRWTEPEPGVPSTLSPGALLDPPALVVTQRSAPPTAWTAQVVRLRASRAAQAPEVHTACESVLTGDADTRALTFRPACAPLSGDGIPRYDLPCAVARMRLSSRVHLPERLGVPREGSSSPPRHHLSQGCGWTYQSDPTFAWSDPTDSDGVGWMDSLERV